MQNPHCSAWCSWKLRLQPAGLEAFDRAHVAAVGLDGEHQARAHRLAVELDRAGAADAVLAADLGPGQALVADEVRQQRARLDVGLVVAPLMRTFIGGPPRSSARRVTLGDERPAVRALTASAASAAASARRAVEQRLLGGLARPVPSRRPPRARGATTTAAPASAKTPRVRACSAYAVRAPAGSGGTRSPSAARPARARGPLLRVPAGSAARNAPRAPRAPRQLGGGSAWTTEPPTVPRERVAAWPTCRTACCQQRPVLAHEARARQRGLADRRAELQRAAAAADDAQPGAVDVDHPGRPHARAGSTAARGSARRPAPARRRASSAASASVDRPRRDVLERRGLHRQSRGHETPERRRGQRRRSFGGTSPSKCTAPSAVTVAVTRAGRRRGTSPCGCRRRPPRARSCRGVAQRRQRREPAPRSRSARQTFSAVNGGSTRRPPSAFASALATAAGAPIVPPSATPLTPSGLNGDGDSTNAVENSGISAAVSSV